jgi:prephenate dehydrogenase
MGATVHIVDPDTHDRVAALISHAPHLLSSAMAAQLADASDTTINLIGNGLRDVIRIAGGNTQLWTEILTGNAESVLNVLDAVIHNLNEVAVALRLVTAGQEEAERIVTRLLDDGHEGHIRALSQPR